MKSWLRSALPKDEYKEKLYLYILVEGTVVLLLTTVIMLFAQPQVEDYAAWHFLIPLISFILYVYGRYIFSGIEYTEVATKTEYQQAFALIRRKSLSFFVLFFILSMCVNFPGNITQLIETFSFALFVGIVHFIFEFLSLKRSYSKNKALVD